MKTLSKITIWLLSLLTLSVVSCKKDLAPVTPKVVSSLSSDYSRVTTIPIGIQYMVGITVDAGKNFYVTTNTSIFKVAVNGTQTKIAGSGFGYADGIGSAAIFFIPTGITFGPDSNLYVADSGNDMIRKVTTSGTVTSVAGKPQISGHIDSTIAYATFNAPMFLTSDPKGNLYVADQTNNSIRVVTTCATVYTLAGYGDRGQQNGPGARATFYRPRSVAIDRNGNVYVADADNNLIRKIAPDRTVSTFAGSGTPGAADGVGIAASFNAPTSVVIDSHDNLYVIDYVNRVIRKITPDGTVSTLAGNGTDVNKDGVGTAASFSGMQDMAIDRDDNLYVTDYTNEVIRKIITR